MDSDSLLKVASFEGKEEGDDEVLPGWLMIKADGRVERAGERLPASSTFVNGTASKDVVIDPELGLWARIFVPEVIASENIKKLPVVVNFFGGGFCLGGVGFLKQEYFKNVHLPDEVRPVTRIDDPTTVNECIKTCKESQAIVVSSSYRLAPENRLPAAYDDGFDALKWLQKQCTDEEGEPWLKKHADFSQVFIMGISAGGNLAHHVMALKPIKELEPEVLIKGLILVVPYFSAETPSASELLYANDEIIPLPVNHTMWRLALPQGANRDHPYCNVFSPDAPNLADVQFPRMLMIVGAKDPFNTRQMEYYNALKNAGKDIELVECPDCTHAFRFFPQFEAENLRVDKAIAAFIHGADQ